MPTSDERGRAAPLTPEERRASILVAVRDLVVERGGGVSTRELARTAGVAEGTLFRVFRTKAELERAAVVSALSARLADESWLHRALQIDPSADIVDRMEELIGIVDEYGTDMTAALVTLKRIAHGAGGSGSDASGAERGSAEQGGSEQGGSEQGSAESFHRMLGEGFVAYQERLVEALRAVLAPDDERLTLPLDAVVAFVETMLVGRRSRHSLTPQRLSARETAALLVQGIAPGVGQPSASATSRLSGSENQ